MKVSVPTSSHFLARLRVVNEVNKDVRSVLVWFEARLNRSLFGFEEGRNLNVIIVSQFLHSSVVLIAIDIGSVKGSVPFIEGSTEMRFGRPDLVNVVFTSLSQVLLACGRGSFDQMSPLLLSTRKYVLSVRTHPQRGVL